MKCELPGEAERLPDAFAFLQTAWGEAGLPEEQRFPFELALEEVFMNVAMHGGQEGRPASATIELQRDGEELRLVVSDDGPAFDPLSLATPDTSLSIEEREVGGLGVFLVREMMDDVSYARREGLNVLSMRKRLA
jgi:sigma-B regulation protein RsbU (phosphoserine phosphatase)